MVRRTSKMVSVEYFSDYVVMLTRLKNGTNGNPRYKGIVIPKADPIGSWFTFVYTTSSSGSERQVAESILEKFLENL